MRPGRTSTRSSDGHDHANQPHPIFLAGRWVDSPDPLEIVNPADPGSPAGSHTTRPRSSTRRPSTAAVAAFEKTRTLPAYERGRMLRDISAGIKARREELGRSSRRGRQADPGRSDRGRPRDAHVPAGAEEAERMIGKTIPLDLMPSSRGRCGVHSALPGRPRWQAISPVRLPAQPGRPQAVAGDRGGLLDRAEAAVQGPAHDAHRRRDRRRGRPARGRGQHPADDPRAGRSDGRGRAVQATHVRRPAVGRLADEGAGGLGYAGNPRFPVGVTSDANNTWTMAPGTQLGTYQQLSTISGGEVISADAF